MVAQTLGAGLLMALGGVAVVAAAAERQPVEGTIALNRFGARLEIVSEFLIQDGAAFVPLRVPAGKALMLRQVTATCSLGYGGGNNMNFWTIRSSPDTPVHHYLAMPRTPGEYSSTWVAKERVEIPVRAGGRPVATFQRSSIYGGLNDACVGSWSGYFEDVPEPPQ